jgi:hypothetical protein
MKCPNCGGDYGIGSACQYCSSVTVSNIVVKHSIFFLHIKGDMNKVKILYDDKTILGTVKIKGDMKDIEYVTCQKVVIDVTGDMNTIKYDKRLSVEINDTGDMNKYKRI